MDAHPLAVGRHGERPGRSAAPGNILLVEDEPLLLRALRRSLERMGHRVRCAASVEEAEPWIRCRDVDVAVVDLRLGTSNGVDWLVRAKRLQPDLEVIVMTGHASVDGAVLAMRRGAFDYLAKPFDPTERLWSAVDAALERRRLPRRRGAEGRSGFGASVPATAVDAEVDLSLDAYERCALQRALTETGGDATRAASLLGVGRSTLYRKLAKHGIARGPARAIGSGATRPFG